MKKDFEPNLENSIKVSLRFLKFKPRTKKETIQKLKSKGFGSEVINQTIRYLEEEGFLDDEQFTINWVYDRFNSKFLGKRKVFLELQKKGIEKEIIQEVIGNFCNSEDEIKRAVEYLEKRFARKNKEEVVIQKALEMLVRSGYSFEISKKAVQIWLK